MERRSWLKRGIIAVGLAGLVGAGVARAAPGGPGGRFGHGGHGHGGPGMFFMGPHLDDLLDDVKATDDQRAKIHAIRDRLAEQGKALRASHEGELKAMVAQWDAATPDAKVVHAHIDERAKAMQAFAHQAADSLIEVHGILTPEQRAIVSKKLHRRLGE